MPELPQPDTNTHAHVAAFITECILHDSNEKVIVPILYEAYEEWWPSENRLSRTDLYSTVEKLTGCIRRRMNSHDKVFDFGLKNRDLQHKSDYRYKRRKSTARRTELQQALADRDASGVVKCFVCGELLNQEASRSNIYLGHIYQYAFKNLAVREHPDMLILLCQRCNTLQSNRHVSNAVVDLFEKEGVKVTPEFKRLADLCSREPYKSKIEKLDSLYEEFNSLRSKIFSSIWADMAALETRKKEMRSGMALGVSRKPIALSSPSADGRR